MIKKIPEDLQRLIYLCGAPRVSTRETTTIPGPRAHILNFINNFKRLGGSVDEVIVGNHMPESWTSNDSFKAVETGNRLKSSAIDLMRIFISKYYSSKAAKLYKSKADWVYERAASFSSMGSKFKKSGIPWVLETNAPLFYESGVERGSLAFLETARRIEKNAYSECDLLICISQSLADIISKELLINNEKILVIPNGVDTSVMKRNSNRNAFDINSDIAIGYVGTVIERQGIELLIKSVSDASKIIGKNPFFIHIVGTGPAIPNIKMHTSADKIFDGKIKYWGHAPWEQMPNIMSNFDVGFSGQISQPIGGMYHSPLKIYEYLAMECPVLASAFDDAKKIIVHGKTGWLFEPGSKDSLVSQLISIYESRSNLQMMAIDCREAVQSNHSWESKIQKIVQHVEMIKRKK